MSLVYSGEKLAWAGVAEWPATSGMVGYQSAEFQHVVDHGPIPEGMYTLSLKVGGNATVTSYKKDKSGALTEANLDVRSEIQSLTCIKNPAQDPNNPNDDVLLFQNWGSNRVRLSRVKVFNKNTWHRGGFYIHDSTKGYTHGCIEVASAFFDVLRTYAKNNGKRQATLGLVVKYTDATTRGKTKLDRPVAMKCS
jgi:hypothetical protein